MNNFSKSLTSSITLPKRIGMKAPSIKEIALEAGVSTATVSDILNGKARAKRISVKTEEKVTKIAKRLDYRPNLVAQALVKQKTNTIGLMFQDLTMSFADEVTKGVFSSIEKENYSALIAVSQWHAAREQQELNAIRDRRLDGALILPLPENRNFYQQLSTAFPLVQIMDWLKDVDVPAVGLDASAAMRDLVTHLYELGHRHIGFLGVKTKSMQLQWRYESFLQSCAELGLSLEKNLVDFGKNDDEESIRNAGLKMLSKKDAPTAIVAVSYPIALQLMEGLMDTAYVGRVAVGCIGHAPESTSKLIGITSVNEPLHEIGRIAADMLMKRIDGVPVSDQRIFLKGTLVPKRSTIAFRP